MYKRTQQFEHLNTLIDVIISWKRRSLRGNADSDTAPLEGVIYGVGNKSVCDIQLRIGRIVRVWKRHSNT